MEEDIKRPLEISGPAHLLHQATKDLPAKYIRDRIMLVCETDENIDTGVITQRWYVDEFVELPPGATK